MQRRFWTVMVVILTLAIFASVVAAAPATENKSVTLISATFNNGTGIVLLFNTTGLTEKDLKNNSFFAHSNEYSLSCNFKDDSSVVRCVAPGGLSKYAGESFRATLAGFAFWGEIPERKAEELTCQEGQSLWYTVSVYENGELVDEGEIPAEFYDFILEIIASNPELFGNISLQITGQFCGEEVSFG